jgi:hypothetical protein
MNPVPKTDVRKRYTNNLSNLKQFFFYKKHYKDTLSKELFNKIWIDFIEGDEKNDIKGVINRIIFDNFEFKFPFRMGSLRIKKKKVKARLDENGKLKTSWIPRDWKSSKELNAPVYCMNKHTMGFKMSWQWNKESGNMKNIRYNYLNVVRTLDRRLAKALKDPNNNLDFYL